MDLSDQELSIALEEFERTMVDVLAIMDLSDQELSIALEEFERTKVDVSDLFLSLLDRTIICAAVGAGAM